MKDSDINLTEIHSSANFSYFLDFLRSPLMVGTQKPAEILEMIARQGMGFDINQHEPSTNTP